jgi:hypothetical protein
MGDGREREAAPQRLVGETEMTMERTGERTKRKGKGKAKKQGWRGMREEGGGDKVGPFFSTFKTHGALLRWRTIPA